MELFQKGVYLYDALETAYIRKRDELRTRRGKLFKHKENQLAPLLMTSFGLSEQHVKEALRKLKVHGLNFYPETQLETNLFFLEGFNQAISPTLKANEPVMQKLSKAILALASEQKLWLASYEALHERYKPPAIKEPKPEPRYFPEPPHRRFVPRRPGLD